MFLTPKASGFLILFKAKITIPKIAAIPNNVPEKIETSSFKT